MKKNTNLEICLLVSQSHKYDYAHVTVNVVVLKDGKVRNFRHHWEDHKQTEFYDHFEIANQIGGISRIEDKTPCKSYGWGYGYKDVIHVNGDCALKMHKTLSAIQKKLTRIQDETGYPNSFGQYVSFIARTLKIKKILFYSDYKSINSSYDNNTYDSKCLSEAEITINKMSAELLKKVVVD